MLSKARRSSKSPRSHHQERVITEQIQIIPKEVVNIQKKNQASMKRV
jgi:hypothetical protein